VRVERPREVGTGHFACTVSDGTTRLDAIAFRAFEGDLGPAMMRQAGKTLTVAGRLQIDEWQGRRRPKLFLEDAREAT
jgi:single-stranded-DNA-specific exonuclease